mgnify:FL=1
MGTRAMSLTIRFSQGLNRRTGFALAVAGAGLAGIAGCALNLSPGERLAASAQEQTDAEPPVRRSALSRLLGKSQDEPDSDEAVESTASSTTTVGRGRLFSALVDRFPSRKKDAADPFLEAEIEAEQARERLTQAEQSTDERRVADARSEPVSSPVSPRTDEELWKMFAEDTAAAVRTRPSPAQQSDGGSARPFPAIAQQQKPEIERSQRSLFSPPRANTGASGTSVAARPASRTETVDNPFAKFLNEQNPVGHVDERTVADIARQEHQDLVSRASKQETAATRHAPSHSTAQAERQLPVSREQDERSTADLRRRSSATSDPFGSASQDSPATSALQGTSPFASGSSIGASLPWTTRVQPAVTSSPTEHTASLKLTQPSIPFPEVPEWRGVRANSPVSLAVIDDPGSIGAPVEKTAVRQADADKAIAVSGATSRSLPPRLTQQESAAKGRNAEIAFHRPAALDGPLLAPPAEPASMSAATPAPPVALNASATAAPLAAANDEQIARTGSGRGGWILGGIMLAAGLWLFAYRRQRPVAHRIASKRE